MGGGVGAHGGAGQITDGDPPGRGASSHTRAGHQAPDQGDLGRHGHVKVHLDLLLFLRFDRGGRRVGGIQQHLEVVVGGIGCPEGGVVENTNLLPHVLHVDLHLLHGAVEDALGLFHRKGNLFGHEVAVVQRDPCPRGKGFKAKG